MSKKDKILNKEREFIGFFNNDILKHFNEEMRASQQKKVDRMFNCVKNIQQPVSDVNECINNALSEHKELENQFDAFLLSFQVN